MDRVQTLLAREVYKSKYCARSLHYAFRFHCSDTGPGTVFQNVPNDVQLNMPGIFAMLFCDLWDEFPHNMFKVNDSPQLLAKGSAHCALIGLSPHHQCL